MNEGKTALGIYLLLWFLALGPLSAQSIALSWDPNTEPDLAGYNVYRSETSGGPYQKLNQHLLQTPRFDDLIPPADCIYFYVVTAVDIDGRESGFSRELAVSVSDFDFVGGNRLVARAGPDLRVAQGQLVVLSGSGWDPEEDVLNYHWRQLSGPPVELTRSGNRQAAFLVPPVERLEVFLFELKVTSSNGATAADTLKIEVIP